MRISQQQLKNLNTVDRLFALLRILVIIGGILWMFLSPLSRRQQHFLLINFGFFCIYTLIIYLFIFSFPARIRKIYLSTLFLDLIFLFWLVKITGGFESEFFLAFLLIIALHSFYFGLSSGYRVIALSALVYLAAGNFAITQANFLDLGLRISFFFLVGISMGLLSRKETQDKYKIQKLNIDLQLQSKALEQEKNKLANILTGIDAGLVLLNEEREILWMNKVTERWFGNSDEHIGKECYQTLWQKEDACKNCPTYKCLNSGAIEVAEIEKNINGEKNSRFFRITSAPLLSDGNKIDRIVELIQDVTQEKELQLHIIQNNKLAAMGELASGIAHELNNPLSAIAVCSQEMLEIMSNGTEIPLRIDVLRENIEAIKNEIQRCKRITTGLLDITPRTEPRRVPIDINHIIKNVRLLVRYKSEKEHKNLKLELQENLPLIMGEVDTLSQVFLNLILNAIEFTPAGKMIQIITMQENGSFIRIDIRDQGCGISAVNLGKIFKPFYTTKSPGMGSGLGLAISLRIVKTHGGEIQVKSRENEGSTFTVLLPVNSEPSLI